MAIDSTEPLSRDCCQPPFWRRWRCGSRFASLLVAVLSTASSGCGERQPAHPAAGAVRFESEKAGPMMITRAVFEQQRQRRFGSSNPERFHLEFWDWMVRDGGGPYQFRKQMVPGLLDDVGPIWCFDRMGSTRTELSDGRVICIGGEHEDYYDPDFCIYNDVIVIGPGDRVEIYGYPRDAFPPTDFHTASLVDDRIILIGCLGYEEDRTTEAAPVFSLDLANYHINRIESTGDGPGWIWDHSAEIDPDGQAIVVRGGKSLGTIGGKERPRRNVDEFRLHLAEGRWERPTDRREWRQFLIRREDEKFDSNLWLQGKDFAPDVPHEMLESAEWNVHRVLINGVELEFVDDSSEIRLLIHGELEDDLVQRVLRELLLKWRQKANLKFEVEEFDRIERND